jgi:hypothetical protein
MDALSRHSGVKGGNPKNAIDLSTTTHFYGAPPDYRKEN